MTLQQLRYIAEVSKCSTISKAAQSLFLTQPTLSKAIKDLEEELGISILERGNSKTRFTAEGTELLCYARQLLEQAQAIENRFLNSTVEKKRFSVSTQHYSFAVKAFIDLLSKETAPDFEFYFRESKTNDIINDVFNKKSDIGIIFLSDSTSRYLNRLLLSKDIEFFQLKTFSPHVFLRKDHPLSVNERISLQQLDDYPCIAYEQDNNSLNFAEEAIPIRNVKQIVYVKDRATTNNIISNTNCYNIGTGCLIDSVIDSNIVSLPIDGYTEKMTVGWIKLKNTIFSSQVQSYIDQLSLAIEESHTGNSFV